MSGMEEYQFTQTIRRGTMSDIPHIPTLSDMAKMMLGEPRECKRCSAESTHDNDGDHCEKCSAHILAMRDKWGRK